MKSDNEMAKRLTDTGKWDDDWFLSLPNEYRLFWVYLCDKCDHAGVWRVNLKLASMLIEAPLTEKDARIHFNDRILFMDGYWFLKKFIPFQYGKLGNAAVHVSAKKILEKFKIPVPDPEIDEEDPAILPRYLNNQSPADAFNHWISDELFFERILMMLQKGRSGTIGKTEVIATIWTFIHIEGAKPEWNTRDMGMIRSHFVNWANKKKLEEIHEFTKQYRKNAAKPKGNPKA